MTDELTQDEGLFGQFKKHAEHATNSLNDWRTRAKEEFEYAAGKQWSDEQLRALQESGKPGLTFNQVHRVLAAVAGSEIINRFEPRYLRRTEEDQGGVDVATAWTRYHRGECDAQHEESKAFMDTLVCGVGCTETFMDYRDDPNGAVRTVKVPIHDMMWDPSATQQNFADGKFCYRGKWVPTEEFKAAFQGGANLVNQATRDEFDPARTHGSPHDASRAWMYLPDPRHWINHQRDEVLVVDYQYTKEEDGIIFTLPDGTFEFEFEDRVEDVRQQILEGTQGQYDIFSQPIQTSRGPRYYSCIITGDTVLKKVALPYRDFTYKFITGFEDRSSRYVEYFGLMRLMKDPQNWANKFMSQLIHIIGTNPKGAVITGPNTFENDEQARRDWARPDGWIKANHPDFKNQIEVLQNGNLPVAAMQMFNTVTELVPTTAGVNMAYFAGQAEDLRRTAGHAVESVQRQAAAVLAPVFDSFKRYRKGIGRLYLRFLREHAQVNQLVRISGPPLTQYAPLSADRMFQRYDVVIDESPTVANNEQEIWRSLTEQGLLPQLLQSGLFPPQAIPHLYPGLPQPIRDMWNDHISMTMQMQQQAAQAAPAPEGEQV